MASKAKGAAAPPVFKVGLFGHGAAGKTALAIQFVQNRFIEEYEPSFGEDYKKPVTVDDEHAMLDIFDLPDTDEDEELSVRYIRESEFFFIVHSFTRRGTNEIEDWLDKIREVKGLQDKANKVDLRAQHGVISREEIIAVAAKNGAAGFYETSAKTCANLEMLFHDAVRFIRTKRNPVAATDKKKEKESKGLSSLLPWNRSKKAEWNSKSKKLDFQSGRPTAGDAGVMGPSDDEIAKFRHPEPTMTKNPVSFYRDIERLLESPEEYADVKLHVGKSEAQFPAHRIILCLRSEFFRRLVLKLPTRASVEVPGVASDAALQEILHFFYANEIKPSLKKETLNEVLAASNSMNSLELKMAVMSALRDQGSGVRLIERSDMVQKDMKPALAGDLKDLADVEFIVEKRSFRLHRAIVCARCKWLQLLVADKWRGSMSGKEKPVIEINQFTADVFAVVIEFIYTGRARISDEMAIDVVAVADILGLPRLLQLAEIALQPVIDSGNAVAVYLAAAHLGATQLKATCVYWMAVEFEEAAKNRQWSELSKEVQESVKVEHAKLQAKRAAMREQRVLMQQMPCVLAPL